MFHFHFSPLPKLEIVVFIGGLVVMVLELVGSRVLAPYVGTSIIVWTSLIGIILASLSVGYFSGGRLADRYPRFDALSFIIFTAGLLILFIAVFKESILQSLSAISYSIYLRTIFATIILFTPPSILLGMITPYAIRLRMRGLETSGATVGNLSALSTLGSIVGTFLAGFFLITYIGTTNILFILSITAIITSLFVFISSFTIGKVTALLLSILMMYSLPFIQPSDRVDTDTQYSRVWINDTYDTVSQQNVRFLLVNGESDSAMFLESDALVFDYTKFYSIFTHFKPDFAKTLMIGGGAYSYPKYFLQTFPDASMDVVEIDPELTQLARTYFRLVDDPRLSVYHEDGRTFLNRSTQAYDIIFMDAYSSFFSVPFHLTTFETVQSLHTTLTEDGLVVANIISAYTGDKSKFLHAQYRTFKQLFPQVYLFSTSPEAAPGDAQNIILVALKSSDRLPLENSDPEIQYYLDQLWEEHVPFDAPILTDDFAPVEQYATALFR